MSAYEFMEVAPGIFQISESGLAMQYLVTGRDRALLVDTGTGIGDLRGEVERRISVPYDVVITHVHRDHFGGAGAFDRVHVPKGDLDAVSGIDAEGRRGYVVSMVSSGSVSPDVLEKAVIRQWNDDPQRFIPVDAGHVFDLGDRRFEVIPMPGHTAGEICLLDRAGDVLISGDSANPIMLLKMKGDDRIEVCRRWHDALGGLLRLLDDDTVICGGHGLLDLDVFERLYAIAGEYLEGRRNAVVKKVHLYTGRFLDDGDIVIGLDA